MDMIWLTSLLRRDAMRKPFKIIETDKLQRLNYSNGLTIIVIQNGNEAWIMRHEGEGGDHAAFAFNNVDKASSESLVRVSIVKSPVSQRDTVDCVTPSFSASCACDNPRFARYVLMSMRQFIAAK
jgi:hypothetical protein